MKVWLIGLGLALLFSTLAVDGSENFSIGEMMGKWYATSIATNCWDILDYKDVLKTMVANIEFADDGTLEIGVNVPLPGGCQKISMNFSKKESGHYFHKNDWGEFMIEDFETDYKNWFIVKTKHEMKSETCDMLVLYLRDYKMMDEKMDTFLKFCMNHGFNKNQVLIMPPEVACAESQ